MKIFIVIFIYFLSLPGIALAIPQCALPTTTCIDSTPCKTISGVTACLSTATLPAGATRLTQSCWDTQKNYNCDLLQINTQAPLLAAGCTQSNSVCTTKDVNGNCTLYTGTFSCPPAATNNASTCASIPVGCTLASSSCMTTSLPGTTLAGTCTATSKTYTCPVPSTTSTTTTNCAGQTFCQGGLCTPGGSKPNADFNNVVANVEMMRQASKYLDPATMTVFKGFNGSCTVQMWAAGLAGDCCKIKGGGQSNNQVAGMIIGGGIKQLFATQGIDIANPSAAGSVVNQAVALGTNAVGHYASNIFNSASQYMFDQFYQGSMAQSLVDGMVGYASNLFTSGAADAAAAAAVAATASAAATTAATTAVTTATTAAASTAAAGAFTASFSYYGLTMSTAPLAAGSSSIAIGSGPVLGMNFSFNPYAFAAAVALQLIMEALACTPPELKLMQQRGANLCHSVGSYCSNQLDLLFATVCLEQTQGYCCYNSKLAKIVNEQGRPQLPRGWGTPEAPSCTGFTMAEMKLLDFSKMDLSEFIADITKNLPDPTALQNGIKAKASVMYSTAPPF